MVRPGTKRVDTSGVIAIRRWYIVPPQSDEYRIEVIIATSFSANDESNRSIASQHAAQTADVEVLITSNR